jgi:hypothetical protein
VGVEVQQVAALTAVLFERRHATDPRRKRELAAEHRVRYAGEVSIRPELRDELLTLSAEERQELADELYESLVDPSLDPEWERKWSDEIRQRVEDVVHNRVELIDADDVHRELRTELRDQRR